MTKRSFSHLRCGLLGEHLGHSHSPLIHGELADYSYSLFEIEKDSLASFMTSDSLDAFNVTIPYKKAVIPYLDEISEKAARIGAVNTVVRQSNGKLVGHNTDYFGFEYMLSLLGVNVSGKKALILGRGGAALTVRTVLTDKGAHDIVMLGSADNTPEKIKAHSDAEIIVNATPVGMYPRNGASPVDLSLFPNCSAVLDLIFNPARTALLIQAEQLGIPSINGLSMLVAQAAKAFEFFTGDTYDKGAIEHITAKIEKATSNIILVGMPSCGKSSIGKIISNKLGRQFVDADDEFEKMHGITPAMCIESFGESHFRMRETETLAELGKLCGAVIATGGGAVTREENYSHLHQNGDIFFIERNLTSLSDDGRPLSKRTSREEMYAERLPKYLRFADATVCNDTTADNAADKVIAEFEKTHDKRGII